MKLRDMLVKGREYLAKRELAKRTYASRHYYKSGASTVVACCAIGAVCEGNAPGVDTEDQIAKALGFEGAGELIDWNDDPSRTKEDVLARFDTVIASIPEEA